jgi:hypothetical protein
MYRQLPFALPLPLAGRSTLRSTNKTLKKSVNATTTKTGRTAVAGCPAAAADILATWRTQQRAAHDQHDQVLEAVEQVAEYEQAAARAAAAAQKLLEEETAQQLRAYRTVKVGQTARQVGSSHLMRRELHVRKVGAVRAAAPGSSTARS